MNGDEDMSEDITMKGDKFHYIQGNNTKNATKAIMGKGCNSGEIASVDGNCYFEGEAVQLYDGDLSAPEKVLTLEPKVGVHHTTFMTQTNATSSLIQLEETGDKHETEKTHALEPIATRAYVNDPANDLTYPSQRTAFYVQTEGDSEGPRGVRPYSTEGYTEAEKVSVPDARITRSYTTFFDKKNGLWRGEPDVLAQLDKPDDAIADNLGATS